MRAPVRYEMDGQIFWLSPERIIFWENENTIIASDLHFGKTGHFRKAGIAMPQSVFKEDLNACGSTATLLTTPTARSR